MANVFTTLTNGLGAAMANPWVGAAGLGINVATLVVSSMDLYETKAARAELSAAKASLARVESDMATKEDVGHIINSMGSVLGAVRDNATATAYAGAGIPVVVNKGQVSFLDKQGMVSQAQQISLQSQNQQGTPVPPGMIPCPQNPNLIPTQAVPQTPQAQTAQVQTAQVQTPPPTTTVNVTQGSQPTAAPATPTMEQLMEQLIASDAFSEAIRKAMTPPAPAAPAATSEPEPKKDEKK